MKNLIKYEFRKTWHTKLIILAIAVCAEVLFLSSLYLNRDNYNGLSIVLLTFLAFGGVLFIGIQSIVTMHQDMTTKQGYMLYMTPNSCYKILGGKVIENGISIFVAGVFFFALGALDITLLLGHHGQLGELKRMMDDLLKSYGVEFQMSVKPFALITLNFLCSWLCTVITAYLADVTATCLLNGKKFSGWVGFLIFILFSWLLTVLQQSCIRGLAWDTALIIEAGIAVVCAAAMYAATAYLMEKRLSV